MIRDLTENEIECKVANISQNGLSLLLYKTARTDMAILDEVFGQMNWQCKYEEVKGNMYCTISVYDNEKKQWIEKQDCGVESAFGDKEKGEASDAFKRAGFKWGIGVELYTSPFIWVDSSNCNIKLKEGTNNKFVCMDKFEVKKIKIENKEIVELSIYNNKTKQICYEFNKNNQNINKIETPQKTKIETKATAKQIELIKNMKFDENKICLHYNISNLEDLTILQANEVINSRKGN